MRTDLIKSECEFNRILEDMRGVDLSGGSGSRDVRYSYLENMYRDYAAGRGELIESVPGFRRIYSGTKINGLHMQIAADGSRYLVINDNGIVYRASVDSLSESERLTGSVVVSRDTRSHSFGFGGRLYLGDAYNLKSVEDGGQLFQVIDGTVCAPYVPTVYSDGAELEERNLLSAAFCEKQVVRSVDKLARATRTLKFRVTDETARICTVSGITDDAAILYIPSTVLIAGEEFTVKGIASAAFSGRKAIEEVYLSDAVATVGTAAFFGCTALRRLVCGASLTEIGDRALAGTALEEIYLPAAMRRLGDGAIPESATVRYELDSASYAKIEGRGEGSVEYGVRVERTNLGIRLRSRASRVDAVTLDGKAVEFSTVADSDGNVSEILINDVEKDLWTGKTLSVLATADPILKQPDSDGRSFVSRCAADYIPFTRVVRECTHSAIIGGRAFLWGGASYPGVIFYSEREDSPRKGLYFGELDYIDVGDETEITSVLGFSDGIAVFSRKVNGGECIRLYSLEEGSGTQGRTAFRMTGACRSSRPLGAAINHGDEILFVSEEGLSALSERALYQNGAVETRSTAVTAMLAAESLAEAAVARWCGYLALSVGGRMYLADTRTEANFGLGREFEWFFLNGIGTYRGDSRVYRYSSVARADYILSDTPDEVVDEEVWSEGTDSGEVVYFVPTEEGKVEVYPTEEFTGGVFYPAELLLDLDGRLVFSTGCGDVCVFNSDMRGVAPARIASDPDFDAEDYKEKMGKRIHPDFYGFHNHAPRYALITAFDDCGVPHLRKNTVKRSLTLKLATYSGRIECRVGRDGGEYHSVCVIDAGATDFASYSPVSIPLNVSDNVTVALPEKERGWIEKSIALYSSDFCAPIGIYSIAYRYKIGGRIKSAQASK